MNSSTLKDKRIFGCDINDFSRNNSTLNISGDGDDNVLANKDINNDTNANNQSILFNIQTAAQDKISEYPTHIKLIMASLVLVLMLLLAEQSFYYIYLVICWSSSSISSLRVMFFSVPDIVNQDNNLSSTDLWKSSLENLKIEFNSDFEKLKKELLSLQHKNMEIEQEKLNLIDKLSKVSVNFSDEIGGDGDNTNEYNSQLALLELKYDQLKNTIQSLSKSKDEKSDIETISDKLEELLKDFNSWKSSIRESNFNSGTDGDNLGQLSLELEKIKQTIGLIKSDSINSENAEKFVSLALDKFPDLSTIGEKFEHFETRSQRLEQKLISEFSLIIEKHSNSLTETLETEVQKQIELSLHNQSLKGTPESEDDLVDWADTGLGTTVNTDNDTRTHPDAVISSLKIFGVPIWRQLQSPSIIIERPHSGLCWRMYGTSGSLIVTLPHPVDVKKLVLSTAVPDTTTRPRQITVWDNVR